MFALGYPNCVRLKILKNSALNSTLNTSLIFGTYVRLIAERFSFKAGNVRKLGSTRLTFPMVKGAGCENALMFKYRSAAGSNDPLKLALSGTPGTRLGRLPGVPERASLKGSFDPAADLYLNINAFSQPAPFTIGNVSRVEPSLRTFPALNENLSAIKRTYVPKISEVFNVEFKAEFFNIFN